MYLLAVMQAFHVVLDEVLALHLRLGVSIFASQKIHPELITPALCRKNTHTRAHASQKVGLTIQRQGDPPEIEVSSD